MMPGPKMATYLISDMGGVPSNVRAAKPESSAKSGHGDGAVGVYFLAVFWPPGRCP